MKFPIIITSIAMLLSGCQASDTASFKSLHHKPRVAINSLEEPVSTSLSAYHE